MGLCIEERETLAWVKRRDETERGLWGSCICSGLVSTGITKTATRWDRQKFRLLVKLVLGVLFRKAMLKGHHYESLGLM